jgi:hypothetical protein
MAFTRKSEFDFTKGWKDSESVFRKYASLVREAERWSTSRDAILSARGAAAAIATADVAAAIDQELDAQIKRAKELDKERFRAWKEIQEFLDKLRRHQRFPAKLGSKRPKQPVQISDTIMQVLMRTQPAEPDFSACLPTAVDQMILKAWQINSYEDLQILSPARPAALQQSAGNPYSYYSAVLERPSIFRFHVWGGPHGSVIGSTAWGIPISAVNCGVEIYCRLDVSGLVDIQSSGSSVPQVEIQLQIYASQYRFGGVDWVQVPYWSDGARPGFYGGEQYIPHASWQTNPDPDFGIDDTAAGRFMERQPGMHTITPRNAELWLKLADVQEGDFFLIRQEWLVAATNAQVDFSWNNVGQLVAGAPIVTKYD